jgi:hypothetical protein
MKNTYNFSHAGDSAGVFLLFEEDQFNWLTNAKRVKLKLFTTWLCMCLIKDINYSHGYYNYTMNYWIISHVAIQYLYHNSVKHFFGYLFCGNSEIVVYHDRGIDAWKYTLSIETSQPYNIYFFETFYPFWAIHPLHLSEQ